MESEPVESLWEGLPRLGVEEVRQDLPLTNDWVYLDSAATSLTPTPVWKAMEGYFSSFNANVERGGYQLANYATEVLQKAHRLTAELLLNCRPEELIFTRNLTQGVNMLAFALSERELKGKKIITSDIEHHSNFLPWLRLCRREGAELKILETHDGILDPASLEDAIDKETVLVSLQHCSNVTGVIQEVREFASICREHDVLCCIDGSQGPGHLKVDVNKMGCDFYGFSGHKGPMGPTGSGGLFARMELLEEGIDGFDESLARNGKLAISSTGASAYSKTLFEPLELGGGAVVNVDYDRYVLRDSPARYCAGTPDIAGEIGLGRASVYVARQIGMGNIEKREKELTRQLFEGLSGVGGVDIYGPRDMKRKAGIVTFNVEGLSAREVSTTLDRSYRICTRSGGHCVKPWHKKHGLMKGTVRASVHYYNTEEEVEKLLSAVGEIARS